VRFFRKVNSHVYEGSMWQRRIEWEIKKSCLVVTDAANSLMTVSVFARTAVKLRTAIVVLAMARQQADKKRVSNLISPKLFRL
jgi:predicted sulfurtransferase